MKLIITCSHLLRHLDKYKVVLQESNVDFKSHTPPKQQFDKDDMLKILPGNDFIIAGDDEIDNKVIKESSLKGLKGIIKWGIGVDNIDLDAARKYKIPVFNTPGVFGGEVAEQALSFILNLSRGTHIIDSKVRNGLWYKFEGNSLKDKQLGIVGYGSIGKEIAHRALSFGMKTDIYDPFLKKEIYEQNNILNVDFDAICKKSDFIVLACSLNEKNKHIINEKSISKMEKKPYIINVSRGPLIKEDDLIKALENDQIRGAGLDVYEYEPLPVNSKLVNMSNCILGSHNSSNTLEAVERVNEIVIEMIIKLKNSDISDLFKDRRVA